jgi:hypothetical protein
MRSKNAIRGSGAMKAFLASALALALTFGSAQSSVGAEYVPPPEAFEGLGGWAVIDPKTGIVYGVIVGNWNEEVWQEVKNTRTIDGYMGCPGPCALRFQTRATADGNVAGWHGGTYHIDENGNATVSNDGSVRFNEVTGTFEIKNQSGSGATTQQTLVPSKTSRDANGEGTSMDIHTGIVAITTTNTIVSESESATVEATRETLVDPTLKTTVTINGLNSEPTVLHYELGATGADLVKTDVISILISKGLTRTETSLNEETGEESSSEVLDSSNSFVQAILGLTDQIVKFIDSLLGRSPQIP